MITINLLPHHPRPTHRAGVMDVAQVAIGAGVLCLVIMTCLFWGVALFQERDALLQEKFSKEQELTRVIKNNNKGQQLRAKQAMMISQTPYLPGSGGKFLPVQVLDEISRSIDPLEVWLIGLSLDGPDVSIEGRALSRGDVTQFIRNLEEASIFGHLIRMETQPQKNNGRVLQQFSFQFALKS